MSSSQRPNELTLILLLGMLAAFGPLAIDMYLPAFPAISQDLHAAPSQVGWTLAIYFAGLAVGQLFVGPATDRYGRTRPLRVGLGLFLVGSGAAALAPRIELLIAARGLQALGGAACGVVARSIVRDLYRGAEAARMNSRMVLVMGVAPILAPLAGGALLAAFGWRSIFATMVGLTAIALTIVTVALPETAPPYQPASRRDVVRGLVGDRDFVGHTLVVALAAAGLFAYITGAPLVYIELHHVSSAHFGWYFGANAAGYILAAQLNARMVVARQPQNLLVGGLVLSMLAAAGFLAVTLGDLGLAPTAVCFFLFLASLGFIMPNAMAIALEGQGARAGIAAAWTGATQFAMAAGGSALVSALADGTSRPMAGIMLACVLLAAATLAATRAAHRRAAAPPGSESDAAAPAG